MSKKFYCMLNPAYGFRDFELETVLCPESEKKNLIKQFPGDIMLEVRIVGTSTGKKITTKANKTVEKIFLFPFGENM